MKNLIIKLFLFVILPIKGQVAIGKSSLTKLSDNTTNNPDISLEFYDNSNNVKGIILPWVSTIKDNPIIYNSSTGTGYNGMTGIVENGTLIFDLSDKKVKYRKSGNWIDLTGDLPLTIGSNTITTFNAINSSIQDNLKEANTSKVVIGSNAITDTTVGILVLSDKNKAMILPKVASPHLNIINPSAGLMVFDTIKKQLAVYNGTIWSFWKP